MNSIVSYSFELLEPGELEDGDLRLVLIEKGWKPIPPHGARYYRFEMRHIQEGTQMGKITLRVGDSETLRYAGHFGFDVDSPHRGHRYAARSVRLLLPFAQQHGLKEVWIGSPPDNAASRRSCELAGGVCMETVEVPKDTDLYEQGIRLLCRYQIDLNRLKD